MWVQRRRSSVLNNRVQGVSRLCLRETEARKNGSQPSRKVVGSLRLN